MSRHVQTPRESVWTVLADFANIADWNSGVTKSFSTSEAAEGVGATRHCDLKPLGALEETIASWEPMREMVVRIDSAAKLPIKTALVTFTLDGDDSAPTVTIVYDYVPKFGPLGRVIAPVLNRQLTSGFNGFLEELEAEAQRRVSTAG